MSKIIFVGLGGCGNNIAKILADQKRVIDDPKSQAFYVNFSNTDLTASMIGERLLIQTGGTGKDPERGAEIIRQNSDQIEKFAKKAINIAHEEIVIITGLGGGTGASLTPFFIDQAQNTRNKGLKVTLIVCFANPKEGVAVSPNMVKSFVHLYNNYVLSEKVDCLFAFDNKVFEKKFGITTYDYSSMNEHIADIIARIYDDAPHLKSSEGYPSLDLAEKKKVRFYGKGVADICIESLSIGETPTLKSSVFDGNYKGNTTKASYLLIRFKNDVEDIRESTLSWAKNIANQAKKKYSNSFFAHGYSFGYRKLSKDMEITLFTNGNSPPSSFTRTVEIAKKDVGKIKASHEPLALFDDSDLTL